MAYEVRMAKRILKLPVDVRKLLFLLVEDLKLMRDGKSRHVVETDRVVKTEHVACHIVFAARAGYSFQQLRGEYPIDVWHDSEEPVLVCMK